MTDDPNSWIQASAKTLAETLSSKNSDYAPGGEFSNFERAARFVGGGMDPLAAMLTQVGIKYTRIESLRNSIDGTNFESIADSLLDLAGYAIIAHAYLSANNHQVEPELDDAEGLPDWNEPDQPGVYKRPGW
jgi:hypothetical protein